jgi:type I restriction enzyme M protein
VGLCKVAGKKEYADEQDYSLNAGRYVGVEIEGDEITQEEFNSKFKNQLDQFENLSLKSLELERTIFSNSKMLLNEF